ncbi:MAG: hypothetical protein COV38_05385 [Bdellovibrionales bacterium CG11_big_fil_rev_8_21_14_0_20_38_13]|nr:MAG: hypothetical protein COV38_05385 [Bdellovibrionales bacterium CG11_big_fil_rev_8_21_14_0_20_38_13]
MTGSVTIKFLTKVALTLVCFAVSNLQAQIFTPETGKTHLRWNLFAGKEQIVIAKRGDKLTIKTLNPALFEDIKNEIASASVDSRYIKETRYLTPKENNNVSTIEVSLTAPDVEVFSFYKDRDKKYVIDFWMDVDKLSALTPVKTDSNAQTSQQDSAPVDGPKILAKESAPAKQTPTVAKKVDVKESQWRDFRYGASFVWNEPALSPQINLGIDLARKTPEFFYPIKDREFNKGDKEAHLQLCINLYKKKEWGLMAKSIELFQRKYGAENENDLLEYLKANALIRENINNGNADPVKSAVSIFSNISARTQDYDLKRATTKYLMAFDANNEDYVSVLKRAKEFYVVSKENHDYEESAEAAKIILHALAKLKQLEKIDELLSEKTIAKILPAQVMLAYKMYAQLELGKEADVLKSYNAAASGLVKPVHEAILFNAAEAMFRSAKFDQAAKLYDAFIDQHSYHSSAALARTRLALSYEMMGREVPLVAKLYKEAIDRSGSSSDEARIRYVAVTNLRNKSPSAKDKEFRVLLEMKGSNVVDKNVQKLLWQTRLRLFIVDGEYEKALSYLAAIPLTGMPATDRRTFEGDGAEIVYGMMLKSFDKGNYAQVIKTWETFKSKYVEKVANDPHINHLVGKSLIKLGLYRGYEEVSAGFRNLDTTPTRTFPLWVKRPQAASAEVALAELDVIKAIRSEDSNVEAKIITFEKLDPKNPKNAFYRGLVARSQGDAKSTVKWMEEFLVSSGDKRDLDSEEIAEMVMAYTDSLYQTNQIKKFEKVSKALLDDTEKLSNSNEYMTQVRERIAYLNLEVLAGKSTDLAQAQLEKGILSFKKNYPNSQFGDRLGFLLGTAMIENAKVDQGVKIFNDMLSDGKVSDTIKDMIKSELSLLKIKERTLL